MAASEVRQWQIEADRGLVNFENYEEYLDSLVADEDMLYLRGTEPRILAQLGYRFAWSISSLASTTSRSIFRLRLTMSGTCDNRVTGQFT